jgi:hypothetical protein
MVVKRRNDWLGHANIQNTTIYAQLTNPARDQQARKLFASQRVGERFEENKSPACLRFARGRAAHPKPGF